MPGQSSLYTDMNLHCDQDFGAHDPGVTSVVIYDGAQASTTATATPRCRPTCV